MNISSSEYAKIEFNLYCPKELFFILIIKKFLPSFFNSSTLLFLIANCFAFNSFLCLIYSFFSEDDNCLNTTVLSLRVCFKSVKSKTFNLFILNLPFEK